MKKFFNASFKQVEPGMSDSFIENTIETAASFKGLKALGFFGLFGLFAHLMIIFFGLYIENNMGDAVVKLDENNEFIGFLSSWWAYIPLTLSFILSMGILLFYRNRNRPKGTYLYNLFFGLYVMFCLLFMFKIFQLFVSTFALRIIYNIIFVFTFFYAFRIAYLNAKELALGTAKQRPFLVEWTSRNFKKISPFLIAIGGAYYAFKALSPDAGNMEQRFIGNLTFIFPFIVALCNFVYIYCCGIFFRGYYVSKYSEEFREKHGYTKKEWYGPKYKDNQAS